MKRKILFLYLLLLHGFLFAQEKPAAYLLSDDYNLWGKQMGDTAYVFSDVAYIRDYPDTRGVLLDSLVHGTPIIITSEGYNAKVIRGFEAPWHAVEYIKEGRRKKGFIWLGLLALGRHVDANGNQFLHGFLKFENETTYSGPQYICEVKCFSPQRVLIGRATYPVSQSGQSYTDSKLLSSMGLVGLQSIHRVGFHGEACGIPTTHYYLGWNGRDFVNMFTKSSVSDAGVSYYEETILFPSEHGLDPALIIKDITEAEVIDFESENIEYKEVKKREKFLWNGQVISQLIEMK